MSTALLQQIGGQIETAITEERFPVIQVDSVRYIIAEILLSPETVTLFSADGCAFEYDSAEKLIGVMVFGAMGDPADTYFAQEKKSFTIRDRAAAMWKRGEREAAYSLYLTDPLGNRAGPDAFHAFMERMV